MTKLEILMMLYSLDALMKEERYEAAKEVIEKVIAQAAEEDKKKTE